MTMGTNPATPIGAPVCLTWEYHQLPDIALDEFEVKKNNFVKIKRI